jgi:16S rRNA (guanine527-N7)-methyltransferase
MIKMFEQYGLNLTEEKISRLNTFGSYLREVNEVMNLTTVTDEGEMWIKHFLDSILGEQFFPQGASVCEVGSGGGFPSVPLKIVRDDLKMTLVESTGKKCEYLKNVGRLMEFNSFNVECARAEELSRKDGFRDSFDVVTARAVARMNTLCEYCMPFVKKGGVFVAYKGDADDEVKEAANAIKVLGGRIKEIKKYTLPGGAGVRNIIVIEKISETPSKYPRGNGKERKKPL